MNIDEKCEMSYRCTSERPQLSDKLKQITHKPIPSIRIYALIFQRCILLYSIFSQKKKAQKGLFLIKQNQLVLTSTQQHPLTQPGIHSI